MELLFDYFYLDLYGLTEEAADSLLISLLAMRYLLGAGFVSLSKESFRSITVGTNF